MAESRDFRYLFTCSTREPLANPTVEDIDEWLGLVTRSNPVTLRKADGSSIQAEGARLMFTITYLETAQAAPLMVGRRPDEPRRAAASPGSPGTACS